MILTCPRCNFSRDVGEVRIPFRGALAACPNCGARFMLRPEQPPREEPQFVRRCPSCSHAHPPGDLSGTCPQCGLIYDRFLTRQRPRQEDPSASPPESAADDIRKTAIDWRRFSRNRIFLGISGVVFIALCLAFLHDWKLDREYRLTPSSWQGEVTFRDKRHPFLLVIQKTGNGQLEGYMDWVEYTPRYRLAVRGKHTGNHLVFEDYRFLEGEGAYGLHDQKDVYIEKNVMSGTDKNGTAELYATRLEPAPM